jgi:hypothetical protein
MMHAKLRAVGSEASAEDAVGCKLLSDKPSLIAGAKWISKLGHVGDERRTNNHSMCSYGMAGRITCVARRSVPTQPKFRDAVRYRDQRQLKA